MNSAQPVGNTEADGGGSATRWASRLRRLFFSSAKRTLLTFTGLFALYVFIEWATLPRVADLQSRNPGITSFMTIRMEQDKAAGRKPRRFQVWRSLSQISPHLRHAVLVAEDSGFYSHKGIDFAELKESMRINWEEKAFVRGASTLTQQLAKNLFLSPSKNPIRKVKEALIARRLEKALSKDRILELYLNVVEWGDDVYGAEAAARTYFNKPASALEPSEAATLAGMLINPIRYNPFRPSRRLERRRQIILYKMVRFGYLKPDPVEPAPAEASRK